MSSYNITMKTLLFLTALSFSFSMCQKLEPFVIHCDFAESSLQIYLTYIDKNTTTPIHPHTFSANEATDIENSHGDLLRWQHILDHDSEGKVMPTSVSIFRTNTKSLNLGTHTLNHPELIWQNYFNHGIFYPYLTCLNARYVALPILNYTQESVTVIVDVTTQASFQLPSYLWKVTRVANLAEDVLALEVENFMGYTGIQVINMQKHKLLIDRTTRFVTSNVWLRARDNALLIYQYQHFPEDGTKVNTLILYRFTKQRKLHISHTCSVEDAILQPNWQKELETMALPNLHIFNIYKYPHTISSDCRALLKSFNS